ncbi:MAG: type II toxin-antitoxin system VapC family toxin [Thermoanaerobaculia bacterium]
MKVILDASAAIAAVLGRESAPAILDVLSRATVVIAPELYAAEVTSAFWKYVTAGQLSIEDATDRLDAALKLVDRRHPAGDLAQEVLREAVSHRHSVYDLFYVVLARREGAIVLSIDTRLRKLMGTMGLPFHP